MSAVKAEGPRVRAIRVTGGHLTARERSAIVEMFARGITEAHTPRISFSLAPLADGWEVLTTRNESSDFGAMKRRTYRATFMVA